MILTSSTNRLELLDKLVVFNGAPVAHEYYMQIAVDSGVQSGALQVYHSRFEPAVFLAIAQMLAEHNIRLVFSCGNSILEPNSYMSGGRWFADIVFEHEMRTVPLSVQNASLQITRN